MALVAVGDVAAASGLDAPVAALTARIGPDGLLLLGDTVQDTGSPREFHERFDPDWSQFRETWMPVVGNHEYRTPDAAGFRSYFNRPSGPLFTCWRLGDWYVIGLDSKKPWNRKQLRWLRALLAGTKGHPKLVAWHRPRFSSGARGDQLGTHFLWDAAKRDPDVRLVLWGHDHDYERMRVPLGRGRSVLAMVVGTGGGTLDEPTPTMAARPWRQAFVDHTTGVLALHLGASGFSWSFLDVDGHVLDKGSSPL